MFFQEDHAERDEQMQSPDEEEDQDSPSHGEDLTDQIEEELNLQDSFSPI